MKRNSNIELLRIISIIMIVISHYTVHNGLSNYNLPIGLNRFLLEALTLGNIGTIIFILITGYFSTNTNKIKLKKVIKLWSQIFFYSILIYMILVILGYENFSFINLIKNIMPITFEGYWFASAYFILYFFSPYLNIFINKMTRKEHLSFIILCMSVFSILHTLTSMEYYGNELIQFLMFYTIGAYFKKYPDNFFKNPKNNTLTFISSISLIIISIIVFDYIGTIIDVFGRKSTYLLSRTSILTIMLAISIFNHFINKKDFSSKLINNISGNVFGVYLISDNNYLRPIIWNKIFHNSKYALSNLLIPHIIVTVIAVMIICIVIDCLRNILLEKPLFEIMDKKIDNFQEKIETAIKSKIQFE